MNIFTHKKRNEISLGKSWVRSIFLYLVQGFVPIKTGTSKTSISIYAMYFMVQIVVSNII